MAYSTVVGFSVCPLVANSLQERLFVFKPLSHTLRATKVKIFVGFSLKPLRCRDPALPPLYGHAYSRPFFSCTRMRISRVYTRMIHSRGFSTLVLFIPGLLKIQLNCRGYEDHNHGKVHLVATQVVEVILNVLLFSAVHQNPLLLSLSRSTIDSTIVIMQALCVSG